MTLNPAIVCFYFYRFTRFRHYRLFLLLSFYKVLNSRTGSLLDLITGFFIIPQVSPEPPDGFDAMPLRGREAMDPKGMAWGHGALLFGVLRLRVYV